LLSLHELADRQRRVEVRALAIRSLAIAGEFWPFVDALEDRRLKAYWSSLIETVREAMAVRPEFAVRLRDVLSARRGEAGKSMFRALWGYTNTQLEEGADRRLVSMLNDEAQDVRVVAFEMLKEITGATYRYRPERPPAAQRVPLHKWNQMAEEGRIRHAVPVAGRTAKPAARPSAPAARQK